MISLLVSSAVGDLNITASSTTFAEVLRGMTRLFSPFLWTKKEKPQWNTKTTLAQIRRKSERKSEHPAPYWSGNRQKTRESQWAQASLLLFSQTAASDGSPQEDSRVAGREIISTSTPEQLECGLSCSYLLRTHLRDWKSPQPLPHTNSTPSTHFRPLWWTTNQSRKHGPMRLRWQKREKLLLLKGRDDHEGVLHSAGLDASSSL